MGCFLSKKQQIEVAQVERSRIQSAQAQVNAIQQIQEQNHYLQSIQKDNGKKGQDKLQQKQRKLKDKGQQLYIDYLLYNLKYKQDQFFLFSNLQNKLYQKFIQQEFESLLIDQGRHKLSNNAQKVGIEAAKQIKMKYSMKSQDMDIDQMLGLKNNLFKKGKVNYASAIFFKISSVKVYTEDILILESAGEQNPNNFVWVPLDSPKEKLHREVNLPEDVEDIVCNQELFRLSQNSGRFIIHKQRWGYLLDIQGCSSFYEGELNPSWQRLLETSYFQDIIKRYAQFVLDKDIEEKLNQREIPSSFDDTAVNPLYVTFYDNLFEHQKKEVGWMSSLEFNPFLTFNSDLEYIPLLDTGFFFHPKNPNKLLKKHELKQKQYYMPGGILASEIGSGKTISVIALTTIGSQLADPSFQKAWQFVRDNGQDALMMMPASDRFDLESKAQVYDKFSISYDGVYLPSLIIVTKNILYQWSQEYQQFAPKLRVLVVEDWSDLMKLQIVTVQGTLTQKKYSIYRDYDIILTHRSAIQVVQIEKPDLEQLFAIHFNRIIYDEMHEISDTLINQRKIKKHKEQKSSDLDYQDMFFKKNINNFFIAVQKIKRRYSWGITGTPDNLNFSNDSFPMVFLLNLCEEYYTLNQYDVLQDSFIQHNMRSNPKSVQLPPLTKEIDLIFMRQIQNILVQGKYRANCKDEEQARQILSYFSEQFDFLEEIDQKLYPQAIKMISEMQNLQLQKINEQIKAESNQMIKNTLKMRAEMLMSEDNFYQDLIKIIKNPKFECNICFTQFDRDKLVVTQCLHNFCYECFEALCKHLAYPDCPYCNHQISKQGVIIHPDLSLKSDSKLEKLIQDYQRLDENDKLIIFTQFHDLTKKISQKLQQIDIPHVVLLGEPSEVNIRLHTFKSVPEVRILIMSIEQAASGINLIEANHIYFMHPIFGVSYDKSRSTYAQCIGRALRVGQSKPVHAKLYCTKGSIEQTLSLQFLENIK